MIVVSRDSLTRLAKKEGRTTLPSCLDDPPLQQQQRQQHFHENTRNTGYRNNFYTGKGNLQGRLEGARKELDQDHSKEGIPILYCSLYCLG